jgi:uncharacterized protein (DUF3084 family)
MDTHWTRSFGYEKGRIRLQGTQQDQKLGEKSIEDMEKHASMRREQRRQQIFALKGGDRLSAAVRVREVQSDCGRHEIIC